MAVFNRYKNILNKFINSLNLKFLDLAKSIDKKFYHTFKLESSLANINERDYLNKKILD